MVRERKQGGIKYKAMSSSCRRAVLLGIAGLSPWLFLSLCPLGSDILLKTFSRLIHLTMNIQESQPTMSGNNSVATERLSGLML